MVVVVVVVELLEGRVDEEVVEVSIGELVDVDCVVKVDEVLLELTTVVELVIVVDIVLVVATLVKDMLEVVLELLAGSMLDVVLSSISEEVVASGVVESSTLVVVEVDTTDGDELVLVIEVVELPMTEVVLVEGAFEVELLGPVGLGGMMLLVVVDEPLLAGVLEELVICALLVETNEDVETTLTELVVGGVYGAAGEPELLASTGDELEGGASG